MRGKWMTNAIANIQMLQNFVTIISPHLYGISEVENLCKIISHSEKFIRQIHLLCILQ